MGYRFSIGKLIIDEDKKEEFLMIKKEFIVPETSFMNIFQKLGSFDLKKIHVLNERGIIENEFYINYSMFEFGFENLDNKDKIFYKLFNSAEGFVDMKKSVELVKLKQKNMNLIDSIPIREIEEAESVFIQGFLCWLKIWSDHCYLNYSTPYISLD